MSRTKLITAAWLALIAGAAGVLALAAACEHDRYWRGAHPMSNHEIAELSDPVRAKEKLDAIMAYAPKRGELSDEQIMDRSRGCMSCHGETDDPDLHADITAKLGCIDCHGGDATVMSTMSAPGRPGEPGTPIEDLAYLAALQKAHIQPRHPEAWYGRHMLEEGKREFAEHPHDDPRKLHGSRNPENTYALLNQESPEFIRFINPGDLRVAEYACGPCHGEGHYDHIRRVQHSMMNHGSQLWGAVTYNNGSLPNKVYHLGEAYTPWGLPARLQGVIMIREKVGDPGWRNPTPEEITTRGVVPYLTPPPTWNIAQMGNTLRIFERGQKLINPVDIGNPSNLIEPGKADKQLSPRGLGTLLKTDPVLLGIQKTRLLDPLLSFLGTNDHPGDFRSSGCSACHVIYANDRETHAKDKEFESTDQYAKYGNMGHAAPDSKDPTIPKNEPGHPIRHVMAAQNGIPSSQCVVCHMHPGESYANTYMGYMWWDNESDGEHMYPGATRTPTPEQEWLHNRRNPEGSSLKGLWSNMYPEDVNHAGEVAGANFLERSGEPRKGNGQTLNDRLQHNQFADWHGHGWMFRAIHKKDRQGHLLDLAGNRIDANDPAKWDKAVHLKDIHLEKGMHCVDCHFLQDNHGDGKLYGEARVAIQITCVDCHGTYDSYAKINDDGIMLASGPAANPDPEYKDRNIAATGGGAKRFEWEDGKLYQYSALDRNVRWEVVQTLDTINPASAWSSAHPESAKLSRFAKTVQRGQPAGSFVWGDLPQREEGGKQVVDESKLAHSYGEMECYTCHTSWMTSCAGCHLPMQANRRAPMLHNENMYTRNWTQYNYQVLRDDTYQLGRDSAIKAIASGRDPVKQGGKIVPVRSSSAVIVSSQNAAREWIYSQQQTVSAEGYSGQAFNPHFPHATSGIGTTKQCTDCHLSRDNDNNAWMAQLLLQGTNFVNFLGRFVYVAEGAHGLAGVVVTERPDPQAVYGSELHRLAYPDEYQKFLSSGRMLEESYHHDGKGAFAWLNDTEILDLQLRGEYLYAARGTGGFYCFDVANIDNKGFSERIITAPFSPLGEKLGFKTSYAVAVASPATIAVDPARRRLSTDPSKPPATIMDPLEPHHINMEQPVHPLYAYIYVGDRDEGLILTFAATLLDGDPDNNFLERALLDDGLTAFNPNGVLSGLTHLVVAGHYVYATSTSGLVIIDIDKPLAPKVVSVVGTDVLRDPQAVAVQFRYAMVTDREGLKTIDVTDPARPKFVQGSLVPLADARRVYMARTYAMVAAGREGLAIVDATNPEQPKLVEKFTAGGVINDARDVKVGMTNASLYAYVADGMNGLRVVQLMGPGTTPLFRGFAPPLTPALIATYKTDGPALAVSKGLDRDRAVDESGNQVAVFGRLGARPLKLDEMQQMYLKNGQVWTVTDQPDSAPSAFTWPVPGTEKKEEESGGRRRRGG
ncbi:MAG: hypothetical protein AB7K52_01860 [Phycisphaerales bacterium]